MNPRQKYPIMDTRIMTRPPPFVAAAVLLGVLLASMLLVPCGRSGARVKLLVTVGSELEDCGGTRSMKCLVVNGEPFHDIIEGFEYEEGYYYRLTIEREDLYPDGGPSPDKPEYRYRLIEVIKRERPPQ